MEQEKKEIEQPNKSTDSDKKRMPKWLRRTLKTVAWTIGSFITLVVVVLCLIVWILTPPRLTPIVESVANDYLNAEVSIGRAELTIWKTFPYMVIDLQKVDVKSKALNGYKGSLPAGSDSLLSVGKVHASFNIAEIPLMKFNIRNILIDEPRINVVIASDSLSNLDIFPPSEEKEEGPSPFIINSLVVNKFQITNNRGITYTDMRDSTYARIDTKTISLDYETDRFYSFLFDGDVHFKSPARQINQSIPIYIKGAALWDIKDPTHCVVRNLNLNVADIPVTLDTDMRFDSVLAVNSLNIAVGPIVFDKVFRHVPANYRYGLDAFKTNFSASAKFTLAAPYKLTGRYYPTFKAELTIPDCYVANQKKGTRINEFGIAANLDFNGLMPNQSTLSIRKILLDGFGIHLNVSGTADHLLNDPNINAKITGNVDLATVLRLLPQEFPFRLAGEMEMGTDLKFALSDLSVNTFQRMKVNGIVKMRNIRYTVPSDSLLFFARSSAIRFGTDNEFNGPDNQIKNVLMASVSMDSVILAQPGLRLAANGFKAGIGSVGDMESLLDSTQLTPIGARISLDKLAMFSLLDSSRIRLNGIQTDASIRRFGKSGRLPLLTFGIDAKRISYSDPMTFLSLRNGDIKLSANIKPQRQRRRIMARIDSICKRHPELPRDSVVARYLRRYHTNIAANEITSSDEFIDLSVDNELQRLFRQWDMRGSIKAEQGRLFTPYFPLRNELKDLDMSFSTKKFDLHSLTFRTGKSDLNLKGEVNNISDAMLGSKRKPLTLVLYAFSDTLDANQIMAAIYRGNRFANSSDKSSFSFNTAENENQVEDMVEQSSDETDTTRYAILIPKNIVLDVNLLNKNAYYTDFKLSDLHSSIKMNNGVLNLRDLSGKSADGNLKLDLVYASADRNDIGMGLYLDLRDINVGRFMKLMPGIDTIMPMLKGVDGVINARLAATTKIDSLMNVMLPTTNAVLDIDGKNLVLLDSETFRQIAKLLRFKNKERNLIDSLAVQAAVYDSQLDVYPFILKMDRYKLGVTGWNDFETNYQYHISVLDSPIFFKFGINLSGNLLKDEMKFRLGKAKVKEDEVARSTLIADTTKVNLFKQMDEIFRRGADAGLRNDRSLHGKRKPRRYIDTTMTADERLSAADSLRLIEEGIIERPDTTKADLATPSDGATTPDKKQKKPIKQRRKQQNPDGILRKQPATRPDSNNDND